MQTLTIVLPTMPTPVNATAHFSRLYTWGRHPLDLVHLIRQPRLLCSLAHQDRLDEDFWANLDQVRRAFAADVRAAVGPVDLLVEAPSTRGLHRPFLAAVKAVYADIHWAAFTKPPGVSSDLDNIDELRAAVQLLAVRPGRKHRIVARPNVRRVLIVDDVIATGGTAAATAALVERLGGEVIGFTFAIELEFLNGRKKLPGYDVHSLVTYS